MKSEDHSEFFRFAVDESAEQSYFDYENRVVYFTSEELRLSALRDRFYAHLVVRLRRAMGWVHREDQESAIVHGT